MDAIKFKDLKKGDEVYVVNEGEDFGVRLETHKVEMVVKKEEYNQDHIHLDDGTAFIVDWDFNEIDSQGFIFTNKIKAQKHFLNKVHDVYCKLVGTAAKRLRQYNQCVEIMNNISEERDRIETELILNGSNLEN